MGLLVDGNWHTDWYDTKSSNGEFIRQDSQFRDWVGSEGLPVEAGRYHLFVSLACPWAHRALIFRKLMKLEDAIDVTVVKPEMLDNGWEIDDQVSLDAGYSPNPVEHVQYIYQLYTLAEPQYNGRVTVPVLWDKVENRIVNNESADIIRMFNGVFRTLSTVETDFSPEALLPEIDRINKEVYDNINNGVYRAGFATTQKAYEAAYHRLFDALDRVEAILEKQAFLVGENVTEADWRLFTTLIRFDAVYYSHFKTNRQRIEDYPNLSNYVRQLYQYPGVAQTVDFHHIKTHYYYSHDTINPTRVVPVGPQLDFSRPHNRTNINLVRSPSHK